MAGRTHERRLGIVRNSWGPRGARRRDPPEAGRERRGVNFASYPTAVRAALRACHHYRTYKTGVGQADGVARERRRVLRDSRWNVASSSWRRLRSGAYLVLACGEGDAWSFFPLWPVVRAARDAEASPSLLRIVVKEVQCW